MPINNLQLEHGNSDLELESGSAFLELEDSEEDGSDMPPMDDGFMGSAGQTITVLAY